jgi:GT2 family glycosyltransferase
MKNVSFVTVNFNNSNYTSKMLISISNQRLMINDISINCIVVDNSTDLNDSSLLLDICSRYDWVSIIKSDKNSGYFGGLNIGLKELFLNNYDAVVVCNNDLEFNNDFVNSFLLKSYQENIYAICPDVITNDGIHQNPHHLEGISFFEKFSFDLYFSNYWIGVVLKLISSKLKKIKNKKATINFSKITACEINQGVGACYVLMPNFFKNCGNKLYFPWFLYGEEACLSWQIRSKGGISWFDPELIVKHDESASTSKLPARKGYEMARTSYWGYRHLI